MYKRLTYFFLAFFLGLLLAPMAIATPSEFSWREQDSRRGYVSVIDQADDTTGTPLVFIDNPDANERTLREKIFDERLTKEFTLKYQEKFGRTEAETFYTRSNVFEYLNVQGREYSQEQYYDEQKSFGTYMVRRTVEYHIDSKGRDIAPAVIETKEKLQNVNVGIGKNIKIKAKYSIAANDFGVRIENPIIDYRMTIPSHLSGTIVSVGKGIGHLYYMESYYYCSTGAISLIGRRKLTELASVSITLTPNYWRPEERVREKFGLAGLTWGF